MRKILSIFAAALVAIAVNADPVVLPATLDVNNVSFRSEGMPDFVLEEGDYAGTYFDMGAHDSANDTLLYAQWDVTIEPIMYTVGVVVYNTNSWRVQLDLLNQSDEVVKAIRYKGSSGQCGQYGIGTLDLTDLAAGNYKVRVHAATAWSAMKLKDVIFAADYAGVAVDLPGTLLPAYAELSSGATVSNNAIAFAPSTANTEYATWNVSFAEAGTFDVTIDMTASNGHTYGVTLLSADGATEIGAVAEEQAWDTGVKALGSIAVPAAGSYMVKLTNATQWSEALLNSITFAAPAPVEPLMKTIYCKMDKDWWKADGAAVGIYAWGDNSAQLAAWPGVRMAPVEGEADLWSFELDINTYKNCIFTRVNGEGDVADWGAKTTDLTIPTDDNDMFTITSEAAVWGDPGCIGEWSKYEPSAPAEMTAIYDWAGEVGTTILGTAGVEISTVKIHTNTDAVPAIKFGSSFVYADGKWLAIKPAEGGFKAGDVLSVSVVFNNADDTKYAQIDLRAANGDTRIWLSDSASTINGRTQAGEPIVQTYTLAADQDSLFLGRYGNTGMFVTLLKVERAGGDEPQPQECDWDAIDFLGDGSTEQTHSNQFKVCKVGEQPNVVNIQTPGFAAETGIYVTFPSAVFGEISLAEGQYVIEGAGMVLYLSAFTQEYTEVTVNWDGNDIVFTVYNAAAAPQPVEHTYTVAGGSADLFGTTWDPANTANDMVKQEDGTYKWEKTEVTLPAGNVEFKVVEDHAWTVCYPAENYQLVIPEAGVYTITITYNPEGNVVAGDAVKTGDAVVDPVVSIAGSMNSWNASADVMVLAEDKATASLTLNLAAQTYEFKVVINGGDWRSNAHEFTRENAVAADMSGNLDNMHLVADIAGDYIFTWTFATNTLVITFPQGEGIDNTAVETKAIKRIVNGQLFIEMNGVLYNAQGAIVR